MQADTFQIVPGYSSAKILCSTNVEMIGVDLTLENINVYKLAHVYRPAES
jgi:hypothetical protein